MAQQAPHLSLGTFPVQLAQGGNSRRNEDELLALRYTFKPASIAPETPGTYLPRGLLGASSPQVKFTAGSTTQVFDVREEAGKHREFVLIFDEDTQAFVLHPLPTTLHLTLNRTASASYAESSTSTGSSSSVPLAATTQAHVPDADPRPAKRSRASPPPPSVPEPAPAARPTKGGKGLPRKKPLESAPIPVLAKPARAAPKKAAKGKAAAKAKPAASNTKSKAKPKGKAASTSSPAPKGKFKSAEFIEDSDEEIGQSQDAVGSDVSDDDAGGGGGGIDEFANLLGQSLAQEQEGEDEDADGEFEEVDWTQQPTAAAAAAAAPAYGGGYYDDDDDDDESESEESEDDGLGGAKLVVRHRGADDGSEWI
ncbi:hypothetical protein IAT38_002817 [Cryptococcus sp. DSM 104549]